MFRDSTPTLAWLRPDDAVPPTERMLPLPGPKPFPIGVRPLRESYRAPTPQPPTHRTAQPKPTPKPVRAATMFALAAVIAGTLSMLVLDHGAQASTKKMPAAPTARAR